MGTLFDQANLAADPGFQRRVMAGIVHKANAVAAEATDDMQTISITGAPAGGTFTLTWMGQTTGNINYNATAADVTTALAALSNIGTGNIAVTGGPGPGTAWVATFIGTLANLPLAAMTHTDSLTGGSAPAVSIAHSTVGIAYANHAPRAAFASKILAGPAFYASIMALSISDNGTVQGDWNLSTLQPTASEATITTDILAAIDLVYNAYI
jgi:hypothetical protein